MADQSLRTVFVDRRPHSVPDMGSTLDDQLDKFYAYFSSGVPFNYSNFGATVQSSLNDHPNDLTMHDRFFSACALPWVLAYQAQDFGTCERVWQMALAPVLEWERSSAKRAHKGTPFYFWAAGVLRAGDIDRGFMLIHRSLKEDVLSKGTPVPDSPGNSFVTLDFQKEEQWLRNHVLIMAQYLETKMQVYRAAHSRKLDLMQFRQKFLSSAKLRPAALYFVYLLHKLKLFDEMTSSEIAQSDFAGFMQIDMLFGLCLVADSILKVANSPALPSKPAAFSILLGSLSQKAGLALTQNDLQKTINDDLNSDFGAGLRHILEGKVGSLNLHEGEIDLALTHAIRNRGAHNIEGHVQVYENFDRLAEGILDVVFLSTEFML